MFISEDQRTRPCLFGQLKLHMTVTLVFPFKQCEKTEYCFELGSSSTLLPPASIAAMSMASMTRVKGLRQARQSQERELRAPEKSPAE